VVPRTSSPKPSSKPSGAVRGTVPRMTSEHFLKHRELPHSQSVADLRKLVKKDEIPVRIFAL
jgi:hypothetical protein